MADYLQMGARGRLDVIPSVNKALHDLGKFAFVALHLLSTSGRHSSSVAKLLYLIERLEELHTEVQRMISSSHLDTKVLYDVLRWWSSSNLSMRYKNLATEDEWRPPVDKRCNVTKANLPRS